MDAFQDRYHCLAFDFRGHGRSEVTDDAEEIQQIIDSIQFE